jgi:hypothetical protein
MEQTKPENQGVFEGRFNKTVTVLLTIVATLVVCLTIVVHWRTYDWVNKFLAVGLLLNLAALPLTIILQSRKGITTKPDMLLKAAYIWLLLATILFNR